MMASARSTAATALAVCVALLVASCNAAGLGDLGSSRHLLEVGDSPPTGNFLKAMVAAGVAARAAKADSTVGLIDSLFPGASLTGKVVGALAGDGESLVTGVTSQSAKTEATPAGQNALGSALLVNRLRARNAGGDQAAGGVAAIALTSALRGFEPAVSLWSDVISGVGSARKTAQTPSPPSPPAAAPSPTPATAAAAAAAAAATTAAFDAARIAAAAASPGNAAKAWLISRRRSG
jgi:hypothetical protein